MMEIIKKIEASSIPTSIKRVLLEELSKSNDTHTPVASALVKKGSFEIVSSGNNHSIIPSNLINWELDVDKYVNSNQFDKTKYPYVIHSEQDCIIKYLKNNTISSINQNDLFLIVTIRPCPECSRLIVQTGIKSVIYLEEYISKISYEKATEKIFSENNVSVFTSWEDFKKSSSF